MLRAFVNCAKTVLPALTSAQWFYQKSINRCIYDCKLRNEKESLSKCAINIHSRHLNCCIIGNGKIRRPSNTLKGSQRMGGMRIFLKTFRDTLFNDDWAGSISLDSTFNKTGTMWCRISNIITLYKNSLCHCS